MGKYFVVIYKTETGYSAHSPDIQGCAATGTTVEETKQNIKEALEFHIEGMLGEGDSIPSPQSVSKYLAKFSDADYFTKVDVYAQAPVSGII